MILCFLAIGSSAKKNGFPTEVAWSWYPDGVTYWTLIRPEPEWLTKLCWDPKVEAATGISKERLRDKGISLEDVVAKIREEVVGNIVLVEGEHFHADLLGMNGANCAIILEEYSTAHATIPYRAGWISPSIAKALDATARERLREGYEPPPTAHDKALGMLLSFDAATEFMTKMFAGHA
jgi:hypothetical protein